MSSSDVNSAVFLTDAPREIERKIKEHAFSGMQDTKKLQKEKGDDLDVDASYQWLSFFLEDNGKLVRIGKEYGSGTGEFWNTKAVKDKLVEVLKDLVAAHQKRRGKVTEEVVRLGPRGLYRGAARFILVADFFVIVWATKLFWAARAMESLGRSNRSVGAVQAAKTIRAVVAAELL